MIITKTSIRKEVGLLPAKGWNGVADILNACYSVGDSENQNALIDDIAATNNDAAMVLSSILDDNSDLPGLIAPGQKTLVDQIISDAKEEISKSWRFYQCFDYDGLGTPFFKTIITIKKIDENNDIYGVSFSGDLEKRLAKYLNLTQVLGYCGVEIETEPLDGSRFEIDISAIVQRLNEGFGFNASDEDCVNQIMKCGFKIEYDFMYAETPAALYAEIDNLSIKICLESQSSRFEKNPQQEAVDTWSSSAGIIHGNLSKHWTGKMGPPGFRIVISNKVNYYIYDEQEQAKAQELADKINALFS